LTNNRRSQALLPM